jgi:phosphoheptose isomerase
MQNDPRDKNKWFSLESPTAYLGEYVQTLSAIVQKVDAKALEAAIDLLAKTIATGRRVYVCGNGGSAAIADHLCCDWTKGTFIPGKQALRTHSLAANSALLTALANDFGYENSFSSQVEMLGEAGDVLVAISSSGNSPNIVKAVESAKARGMKVVGLSGFAGGKLAAGADLSLHVEFDNYGLVEDCHQVLMHVMSQYLIRRIEKQN